MMVQEFNYQGVEFTVATKHPQKRNFIVFLQTRASLTSSIRIHRKFGILLI